jgi:hypothetical protein
LEVILARLIADALREALMRRTHVEHSRAVWSGRAYWGPDAQPLSPAAGNPIGEPFVH